MTKKEARIKYKALRQSLSEAELEEKSLAICNRILKMPLWGKSFFHVFLPIEGKREVNTECLLHLLSGKDKNIVISKSDFDMRHMTHFLLTDNIKIRNNAYGIPEPVDGIEVPVDKVDVVFVPLLAFDKKGNRVGYGKGFYDIFLSKCRPDVIRIGVSVFEAEEMLEDIYEADVKLDYCVTPDSVYDFGPSPDGSGYPFARS
ncbi:MAG TPA: 5-formyltetrahydrofolate cyclo-ligase [Flavobacterium sp.]